MVAMVDAPVMASQRIRKGSPLRLRCDKTLRAARVKGARGERHARHRR